MAMGKRGRQRQENLFIASNTLVKSPGHPFYEKLNQVLEANGFDEFVEGLCITLLIWVARAFRPGFIFGCF